MAAVSIWTQGSQGTQEAIPMEFVEGYRVNYYHRPIMGARGGFRGHHAKTSENKVADVVPHAG